MVMERAYFGFKCQRIVKKGKRTKLLLVKSTKKPLSVLVCTKSSSTHRLKLVVLNKSKAPRALCAIMMDLPAHYFPSAKAGFTSGMFLERFQKYFAPALCEYQIRSLKIAPENMKAFLILDNAPAHPSESVFFSGDGRTPVIFLPPNTTPVLPPID